MHKRNPKKKQKKRTRGGDASGRNKENLDDESREEEETQKSGTEIEEDNEKDLCYDIKHSDVMGKYIVARRNIKPGEMIIFEPALIVGPCAGCQIVCLGCYKELEVDSLYKCEGCKWPLCSRQCRGNGVYTGHSKLECQTLKTITPDYSNLDELKESYHALTPLRCLLLKSEPENWRKLQEMESHNDLRKARGDIYPENERLVINRLKKWKLNYSDEEVHTVCGVLEVNAFEVGGSEANARALYHKARLLAHDCTPSSTHTDHAARTDRALALRAAVAHRPGDIISLCYAYTLQGTLQRRAHVFRSKLFWCSCARCTDRTELGSFAAALQCPRCSRALLSCSPLDPQSAWVCDPSCGYTMPAAAVDMLIRRLTEEYEAVDASDVEGFEGFLHKFRNVLAPTHYLRLCAMHSLSQLYGKVSRYMIQDMTEAQLQRKIEICRDLMKVFDIVEPGYSRLRGVTLYELHAPLMILTTRNFEKKSISKEELRNKLKEIVGYLRESALVLGFEPSASSEGLMAAAAEDALAKIRSWEKIIGKI